MSTKSTGTITAKNISTTLTLCYTHTATFTGEHRFQPRLDNVIGSAVYTITSYVQYGGAGTVFVIQPKTDATLAAGETTPLFPTITIDLSVDDVFMIYIKGTTGDTAVTGTVDIWTDNYSTLTQVDILSDATPFAGGNINATILSRMASFSYTTPPTTAEIDTLLSTNHGAGTWVDTGSGGGAIEFTYGVLSGVTPIENAKVIVTTDIAGTNQTAVGYTNAAGNVVFHLDAGTYYFWTSKAGYSFTNPDTEIVSL